MTQAPPKKPEAVSVRAPARLHMGFLDMNGALGRRFGSIGLAIDRPATHVIARRADANSATGPEAARVLRLLEMFGGPARHSIEIKEAIPAHAGLGSGTQLALAVGTAIARLDDQTHGTADIAGAGERGARSGIGVAAFNGGGFLIDGGRGPLNHPPPVTLRSDFPTDWRVILLLDPSRTGVSGDDEKKAFADLPDFPESAAAHICHLVLMKLVPGLKEHDIASFGNAVTEIQQIVGAHFAPKQGGSAWTSSAVGALAARMQDLGAVGIGQSSWGPTGFGFVDSPEAAERLYHSLVEAAKSSGVELVIARGRNVGARVENL